MRRFWTNSEIEALKMLYPDRRCEVIADALGRSLTSIYNAANKYNLHKSEDFKESESSGRLTKLTLSGEKYRFTKGSIPANKNKKWDEYMSKEAQLKSLRYCYKKGHLPLNTKSDGEITIRSHDGYTYKFIRIRAAKWVLLHVYNWEKVYGKVPEGYIVVFKTPDKMNCDTNNLELITLVENMRRNTIHRYPPELKSTIRIFNKLKRTINGKEQNSGSEGSSLRDNRVA